MLGGIKPGSQQSAKQQTGSVEVLKSDHYFCRLKTDEAGSDLHKIYIDASHRPFSQRLEKGLGKGQFLSISGDFKCCLLVSTGDRKKGWVGRVGGVGRVGRGGRVGRLGGLGDVATYQRMFDQPPWDVPP